MKTLKNLCIVLVTVILLSGCEESFISEEMNITVNDIVFEDCSSFKVFNTDLKTSTRFSFISSPQYYFAEAK